MILNILNNYQRPIIYCMLPILFLLLIDITAFAQDESTGEAHSTNVRWSAKSDVITISYDLIGSPDVKYSVSAIMKSEKDTTFNLIPFSVEGDIGEGYFAGTSKQIVWYYRRDYPKGLKTEEYYFEIYVKPIEQPKTWIYYAVGAAAVTGGLIALLVKGKQSSEQSVVDLPMPPGRP